MARIRSVKPELRRDLTAAEWPRECRYAWVLLWGYLDDHGRGLDDLRLLVADLFPLDRDVTERKLDGWLNRMSAETPHGQPPLCRYEVAGRRFLHAPKWTSSQKVSHPQDSKVPPCPLHDHSGAVPESLPNDPGTAPTPFATSRAPEDLGSKGAREKEEESAAADPPRTDVERLCRYFLDSITGNGVKATITEKWRTEARLLLDRDQRDRDEIRRVIDWCAQDTFWKTVVHSVPKLREKYDQLRLAMDRGKPTAVAGNPHTAWAREQG